MKKSLHKWKIWNISLYLHQQFPKLQKNPQCMFLNNEKTAYEAIEIYTLF